MDLSHASMRVRPAKKKGIKTQKDQTNHEPPSHRTFKIASACGLTETLEKVWETGEDLQRQTTATRRMLQLRVQSTWEPHRAH